jgi:hypothetical protein
VALEKEEDYTIGKIWVWKKNGQPKPDVMLNYGHLVENPKATIPGVGSSMKWVSLLPNGDLVVGPDMILSGSFEAKDVDTLGRENKEFKNDMIFLKKAMTHGTINLNEFPKK